MQWTLDNSPYSNDVSVTFSGVAGESYRLVAVFTKLILPPSNMFSLFLEELSKHAPTTSMWEADVFEPGIFAEDD